MDLVVHNFERFAFAQLSNRVLTDSEFLEFCAEHEDLRIESTADGLIELMPGTGPDTGDRNAEVGHQLRRWVKQARTGRSFDSCTLFVLPSGRPPFAGRQLDHTSPH